MGGDIPPIKVAGGCPKCGDMEVEVPEDYSEETEITCAKCGHRAPHLIFFKAGEE
jgi:DNA-directed RNA polymerase subunit RPC12/RpoP